MWRVVTIALVSRFLTICLVHLSDAFVKDYDTSTSLLRTDCELETISKSTHNFPIVWDSVFFYRIFQCGYEFEHYHAFLPGLPSDITNFFFQNDLFRLDQDRGIK